MIILRDTDSIQVILGGAVTTNELPFVASYVDVQAPDTYEPDSSHGATTGAVDAEVLAAPAAGKRRQLKYLGIHNLDTVAANVTVKFDRSATQRELIKAAALPAGALLTYEDGIGWRVNTADGGQL
jgi:hypothetical protein